MQENAMWAGRNGTLVAASFILNHICIGIGASESEAGMQFGL